jgi:tetratricopeptide (TPR) repeat protein
MRRVSLAVVAVALILTSPVIAQTTPAANPSPAATTTSPLLDAERLYRAGKYTDAMLKYEEALKQNPKSGAAYEGAVRTYLSLDMVKEAWTKAQEGVKQAPEQSMTHTATGEVLFRKGKFQEAQREFVTAINANDRDARAIRAVPGL